MQSFLKSKPKHFLLIIIIVALVSQTKTLKEATQTALTQQIYFQSLLFLLLLQHKTRGNMVYFSYPCCMFFQMTTFVANGILVTTMLQEFNFFHNITPFFTRLFATVRHLFDGHNFICFNISGLRERKKEIVPVFSFC